MHIQSIRMHIQSIGMHIQNIRMHIQNIRMHIQNIRMHIQNMRGKTVVEVSDLGCYTSEKISEAQTRSRSK